MGEGGVVVVQKLGQALCGEEWGRRDPQSSGVPCVGWVQPVECGEALPLSRRWQKQADGQPVGVFV